MIARNEYRLITSGFRKYRLHFPFIMAVIIGLVIFYAVPMMVDHFASTLVSYFLSIAAVAMVNLTLFMFFFMFMTFPISYALKEIETGELEIVCKAPVRPADVMLGKFMGQLPFYAIAFALITGIFVALMDPLGIDAVQKTLIVVVFVMVLLSGLWIGTVIAGAARTKLGRSARGRDIGNALSLIIVLPGIALMYGIMGGNLGQMLSDPDASGTVNTILSWLPSTWGGDLTMDLVTHPGNTSDVWIGTLARMGGVLLFFAASLYIGFKAAERTYSLEFEGFGSSESAKDGGFYRGIHRLGGGGSSGTILVSIFKDYGRRMQNISKIIYIIALIMMMAFLLVDFDDVLGPMMMANIIFAMLAGFVVGEVTLRGKETLFIYRKAPGGVGKLIKGRLIQGFIISIPVAVCLICIILYPTGISPLMILVYSMYAGALVSAYVLFALGWSFIIPAYSEKSGEFMGQVMTMSMISFGVMIFSIINFEEPWGFLVNLIIIWAISSAVLVVGEKRLNMLE